MNCQGHILLFPSQHICRRTLEFSAIAAAKCIVSFRKSNGLWIRSRTYTPISPRSLLTVITLSPAPNLFIKFMYTHVLIQYINLAINRPISLTSMNPFLVFQYSNISKIIVQDIPFHPSTFVILLNRITLMIAAWNAWSNSSFVCSFNKVSLRSFNLAS